VSGCGVRFNRQLHPEEKTLAKQLAEKGGGKYTEQQIEDQMRLMGATINGKFESGVPDTLIGQTPTDAGASWQYAGKTNSGQPILTQNNAATDPDLQRYIANNYASADPDQVPSIVSGYTPSPSQPEIGPQSVSNSSNAGTICPRGNCGMAYKTPSQQQVGDAAGFGATQLDRVSAMATALAAAGMPIPYVSVPAEAVAVWASAGSWFLNGVQQATSPNFGGYTVSNGIGQITGAMTGRYPMSAPVINELGNMTSNSGAAQNAQDWVNTQWLNLKGKFQ
jgi:filamentous hemagglutinin